MGLTTAQSGRYHNNVELIGVARLIEKAEGKCCGDPYEEEFTIKPSATDFREEERIIK